MYILEHIDTVNQLCITTRVNLDLKQLIFVSERRKQNRTPPAVTLSVREDRELEHYNMYDKLEMSTILNTVCVTLHVCVLNSA